MSKKMLFVFNPHSGKAQIKNRLLDIIDIFVKDGWTVDVHPTQSKGDAFDVVGRRGARFDTVVVSGGDGTLNECIHGLMQIAEENVRGWATFPRERQTILHLTLKYQRI